jgi:hypothetical protein
MSYSSYPDHHLVRLGSCTPVLFDCVQAGPPQGLELDIWHAMQHLPVSANARPLRRYAAPAHAGYMFIQELGHEDLPGLTRFDMAAPVPAALSSHMRCLGHPLGGARRRDSGPATLDASYAYPIFFNVPQAWQAQFNDWYDSEHIPMLLACPQWLMCRRFRLQEIAGCPWTHMALHYLSNLSALQSPERAAARSTPWRLELDRQPWFTFTHRLGMRLA